MRPAERTRRGFTLVEMMVAVGASGIIAVVIFALLNFGTTLFAKNLAINMAHQQARNGVLRVVRDLHRAVSIPQLADADFKPITSSVPGTAAAAITFQVVAKGPFEIVHDPSSPKLLHMSTGRPGELKPEVGDRFIVLDQDVEAEIEKIPNDNSRTNHWNIFVKAGTKQVVTQGGMAVCYVTQRVGYVVKDGELRFHPDVLKAPATYHVVAHHITTATPFSVPLNESGTPDTRYTAVNISALDPTYSNRGYNSTGMQLVNARVPYRWQMTKYQ